MSDIDPDLMARWRASPRAGERAAARIAAELIGKPRWHPLDGTPALAARLDLPGNAVRRAKTLLADNGVIMKSDSRFYAT